MDTRCVGCTAFSQLRATWQIGLKFSTSDINFYLPRCQCSCGAFFVTDSLPRTIWCGRGFLFIQMRCACPGVGVVKQQHTFLWIATYSGLFGLTFGFGWVSPRHHQATFINTLSNSLTWRDCLDPHICFLKLSGLLLFG